VHILFNSSNEHLLKTILCTEEFDEGLKAKKLCFPHIVQSFLILDRISDPTEEQLINSFIPFYREIYRRNRLNGQFEHIPFPSIFKYAQNEVLKVVMEGSKSSQLYQEDTIQSLLFSKDSFLECFHESQLEKTAYVRWHSNFNYAEENRWKKLAENSELIQKHIGGLKARMIFTLNNSVNGCTRTDFLRVLMESLQHKETTDMIFYELLNEEVIETFKAYSITKSLEAELLQYQQNILLQKHVKSQDIDDVFQDVCAGTGGNLNKQFLTAIFDALKTDQTVSKVDIGQLFEKYQIQSSDPNNTVNSIFVSLREVLHFRDLLHVPFLDMKNVKKRSVLLDQIIQLTEKMMVSGKSSFTIEDVDFKPDAYQAIQEYFIQANVVKLITMKQKLVRTADTRWEKINEDRKRYFTSSSNPEDKYTLIEVFKQKIERIARDIFHKPVEALEDSVLVSDEEDKNDCQSYFQQVRRLITEENEEIAMKRILDKLVRDAKAKTLQKVIECTKQWAVQSLGMMKAFDMFVITTKDLQDAFKGAEMPREVLEYVDSEKNLVLSFQEYSTSWDWRAFTIAMMGIAQIILGTLVIVYGNVFGYQLGSGIISCLQFKMLAIYHGKLIDSIKLSVL
jgi:hypothetical protein